MFKQSLASLGVFLPMLWLDPSSADEQKAAPTCFTYEMAKDAAQKAASAESNASVLDYSGEEALKLVQAINDAPPKSAPIVAERVLVLERPGKDSVELGVVIEGCFKGPASIDEKQWSALKQAAFGDKP